MATQTEKLPNKARSIYTEKNNPLEDDECASSTSGMQVYSGDYLLSEDDSPQHGENTDDPDEPTAADAIEPRNSTSAFIYDWAQAFNAMTDQIFQNFWSNMNPPVKNIIKFCRIVPLVFAAVTALSALLIPELRNTFIQISMMDRVVLFMSDVIIFLTLGWAFGFSKMPVNYIFLMITKQFALANDYQLMSVERLKDIQAADSDTPFSTISIAVTLFLASAVITKFSDINVVKSDSLAILGTMIVPMIGTFILLSSLCIDLMGKENHLSVCKFWSSLAFITSAYLMLSVYQKLLIPSVRKHNFSQQFRTYLEIIFCFIQMYYVHRYILVIHPDYAFQDVFSRNNALFGRFLLPKDVLRLWDNTRSTVISSQSPSHSSS